MNSEGVVLPPDTMIPMRVEDAIKEGEKCGRGHVRTVENTKMNRRKNKAGVTEFFRSCKTCEAERRRERRLLSKPVVAK